MTEAEEEKEIIGEEEDAEQQEKKARGKCRMGVLSGWTEGILLAVAFIVVLTIGISSLNHDYSKTYTTPLTDNDTMQSFIDYQEASQTSINEGNVLSGGLIGVNIGQSYELLKGAVNIVWSFISGGWLRSIADMVNLGESGTTLAIALQIIWILGIIFALLYVFFKVII